MISDEGRLSYEDKELIEKFMRVYPEIDMYPYFLSSITNLLENNKLFRKYVLTYEDGDKVFCVVKDIRMYQTQRTDIYILPISLNKNVEHEKDALQKIVTKDNIQYALARKEFLEHYESMLGDLSLEHVYDDYFTILSTRWDGVNLNEYLRRHKIRQIGDRFQIRKLTPSDYFEVSELHDIWFRGHEKAMTKNLFRNIFSMFDFLCGCPYCFFYGMFLDNKLVGYGVIEYFYKGSDKVYAHEVAQQTYRMDTFDEVLNMFPDRDILKKCLQNISQVGYYYLMEELKQQGIYLVSVAGSVNMKGLANYKMNNYKNVTYYDRYNIKI